MSTKFTAAQLRGLKAEYEKEIRQELINTIVKQIKDKCIEVAKLGQVKYDATIGNHFEKKHMILSLNKYQSLTFMGQCTEDIISECITILMDELPDCTIEGEIEDRTNQKSSKFTQLYTITVDWSGIKPEVEAATLPEVSEVEKLKARIAELEEENSRLKSNSTVGPVSQITSDLLDIFAGFGAIIPK